MILLNKTNDSAGGKLKGILFTIRVYGESISIHWSWLPFIFGLISLNLGDEPARQHLSWAAVLGAFFGCGLSIHLFSQLLVAARLQLRYDRITLYPVTCVLHFSENNPETLKIFRVKAAGFLAHLIMAIFPMLLIGRNLIIDPFGLTHDGFGVNQLLSDWSRVHCFFLLINLLPSFPLTMGQLLLLLFQQHTSHRHARSVSSSISVCIGFSFLVTGIFALQLPLAGTGLLCLTMLLFY